MLLPTAIIIFSSISRINMHQLEDERSPGDDASPPGQQVPAHQALQHGAFTTALETQNAKRQELDEG